MARKGKQSQAPIASDKKSSHVDVKSNSNKSSDLTERPQAAKVIGTTEKDVSQSSVSSVSSVSHTKPADVPEISTDSREEAMSLETEREAMTRDTCRSRGASLEDMEEAFSPPWSGLSFSCGGWLQFYLFGVARAFQVAGLDKDVRVLYCVLCVLCLVSGVLCLHCSISFHVGYRERLCRPFRLITNHLPFPPRVACSLCSPTTEIRCTSWAHPLGRSRPQG